MTEHSWIFGEGGVPRTGQSYLTDDEVVVCDAIFDAPTLEAFVCCDDFAMAFNLPYGRFASVPPSLVEAMIERKIIGRGDRNGSKDSAFLMLTPDGVAAWELERRPVWDAYCSREEAIDPRALRVRAVSEEVAKACATAWLEATGSPQSVSEWRFRRQSMGHFPYWREGPFYVGELALPDKPKPLDFMVMQSRRIWWSTVTELLESQGALVPVPRPPGPLRPLFRSAV